MNREQIIDFIQQTQTMIQQLGEMQKSINQGKALKEFMSGRGEDERALEMAKELRSVEDMYDKSSTVLLRKCKKDTLTGCETLLEDIATRLKLADEAYSAWRTMLASHELETQLNPDITARQEREQSMASVKTRAEAALEQAAQLVPSPGVVIL